MVDLQVRVSPDPSTWAGPTRLYREYPSVCPFSPEHWTRLTAPVTPIVVRRDKGRGPQSPIPVPLQSSLVQRRLASRLVKGRPSKRSRVETAPGPPLVAPLKDRSDGPRPSRRPQVRTTRLRAPLAGTLLVPLVPSPTRPPPRPNGPGRILVSVTSLLRRGFDQNFVIRCTILLPRSSPTESDRGQMCDSGSSSSLLRCILSVV